MYQASKTKFICKGNRNDFIMERTFGIVDFPCDFLFYGYMSIVQRFKRMSV